MTSTKYIGMDVHKESISMAVRNATGKIVMECVIETKASMILQFFDGLRGDLHVTFEEGTWAAWLYDLLKPHVTKLVVCDPRRNALLQDGNQNDRVDARKLSDLLYLNKLNAIYHGDHGLRTLKELGRSYLTITRDQSRVMSRVKAMYRSWAIPCSGKQVYGSRYRAEWLAKIHEPGVRRRAELYYQQLDALRTLRQEVRRDLLAESKKHKVWKRLCEIPAIGPIRAAELLGILQTPHRFRTKRQLWTYCGLGVVTSSSADHEVAKGQLRREEACTDSRAERKLQSRSEEPVQGSGGGRFDQAWPVGRVLCGSSVERHAARDGTADPGAEDCHHCFDRVEERSVLRRQSSETTNSLSVSDRVRSILGNFSAVAVRFSRHSGSRASLSW
jgi:transposase